MLNAAPSFLNVFHRLVASIMQEGRQRGEADTGWTYDILNQYRENAYFLEKTVLNAGCCLKLYDISYLFRECCSVIQDWILIFFFFFLSLKCAAPLYVNECVRWVHTKLFFFVKLWNHFNAVLQKRLKENESFHPFPVSARHWNEWALDVMPRRTQLAVSEWQQLSKASCSQPTELCQSHV